MAADQSSASASGSPRAVSVAIIQDLKVAIHDSSLILPSYHQPVSNKSFSLNNIDRAYALIVLQTLHFFSPNPHFPPDAISARLRTALQRLVDLPDYEFLAGRLNINYQTDRMEIDCNSRGVGFVVASSELSLDEIGELVSPNPAYSQLLVTGVECFDDDPLCVLQATSFTCGSFVMGLAISHGLFDGAGLKMFLEALASQAFDDKPIAVTPYNDRSLLSARSPPRVSFPHSEIKPLTGREKEPIHSVFDPRPEYDDIRTFSLSSKDIEFLMEKAKASTKVTKFNVVAAHVWRCKALSKHVENNSDRESLLLYAVDIRSRMKPPLPENYCGNAVLCAYATARCRELEEGPFWRIVDRVYEGQARITEEYARSFIDWTEIHLNGYADGETLISSLWRLGFEKVEYPWGKPRYSGPLMGALDVILLTPEIDGGGGVNVLIALTRKEMDKFQNLFYHCLQYP